MNDWLSRNRVRIFLIVFLLSYGYWAAGWKGFLIEFLFVSILIFISVVKPLKLIESEMDNMDNMEQAIESIAASVDTRRTTFIRIREPIVLLLHLRIGGKMIGLGWKDLTVKRYDLGPEEALEEAVEEFSGYRVSHYVEQHPDAPIENPGEDISESSWVEVDPRRDLPNK